MQLGLIDLIRVISVFQLLVFSAFLFMKRRNKLSSILLGVHLVTQALGIFGSFVNENLFFYNNFPHLLNCGITFMFLWGPTFYFYVRSFAFPDFRLKWNHLFHLIPFFIMFIYLSIVFYFHGEQYKLEKIFTLLIVQKYYIFSLFIFVQVLVYNIASLLVLRSYSDNLKRNFSYTANINLNWLKLIIICFIAAYFISLCLFFPIYYHNSFRNTFIFTEYLVYLVFFNIIFFKGWYQQEIFSDVEEKTKYKSSSLTKDEAEKWITKLDNFVKTQKPYLNPGLTINQLAEDLEIPTRTLSQILNEYYHQNFYDYISKLRIEEATRLLGEPGTRKTILEVIYDTGYNSKSAFCTAFKKYTGLTPTEFKKKGKSTVNAEV